MAAVPPSPAKRSKSINDTILPISLLKRLPKAELHCHLDGSVRPGTILALAREQGVPLPASTEAELTSKICVSLNCSSLEEYLVGFGVTLSVLQHSYAITRVMYEVAEDAVADGISYLEVRFSPILHIEQGLSLSGVMRAVVEGAHMAEHSLPITVRVIVCGMRHMSAEDSLALAELAWRYRNENVVAFDLAGPEMGFSSKQHVAAFDLIRKQSLNVTLHAGEGAGAEYILDSIRFCGAHRIGHGCALINDPALMSYVVDKRIALETCITSNVQTKAVSSLESHPIKKFFDAGVIVCPSTDNRTVSDVTLTGEYNLLQRTFGFTVDNVVRMLDYGFCSAFLTHEKRARLRAEALHTTLTLLKSHGYDTERILSDPRYDDVGIYREDVLPAELTPYWGSHTNPELTEELLQQIPKVDLHCRLDGAVGPRFLWDQLGGDVGAPAALAGSGLAGASDLGSFEVFSHAVCREDHTPSSLSLAKDICLFVMQSKKALEAVVNEVLREAAADGVTYLELMVRPESHTGGDLSEEQVVKIVLDAVGKYSTKHNDIKVGVVLFAKPQTDDPITFMRIAELTVQNLNKGVVGFGVFGAEDAALDERAIRYFGATFSYLKKHNVNVAVSAGQESGDSVITALHEAGASRISGAYKIHCHPDLTNYLAMHSIPVELSPSPQMKNSTADVKQFLRTSPFRLFLDQGVKVSLCTIRGGLQPHSRSTTLSYIQRTGNLHAFDVLSILANGFMGSFAPLAVREELHSAFWQQARSILGKAGFKYLQTKRYFPAHVVSPPQDK